MAEKVCGSCRKKKPKESFYSRCWYCKPCEIQRVREWQHKNQERKKRVEKERRDSRVCVPRQALIDLKQALQAFSVVCLFSPPAPAVISTFLECAAKHLDHCLLGGIQGRLLLPKNLFFPSLNPSLPLSHSHSHSHSSLGSTPTPSSPFLSLSLSPSLPLEEISEEDLLRTPRIENTVTPQEDLEEDTLSAQIDHWLSEMSSIVEGEGEREREGERETDTAVWGKVFSENEFNL